MIGVLTHHWSKPGQESAAIDILQGNGKAQSKAHGFVKRYSLTSLSTPSKISSLVIWDSNEIYEDWKTSPERKSAMLGAERLWDKPPESERFEVTKEILSTKF